MQSATHTERPSYAFVEGLHLRQWAIRLVVPLAALATNGSGALDVNWLPRFDTIGAAAGHRVALQIAGCAIVALAAVLRVAAKGVLVRKTTLTTRGVYGLVRHPFYLANLAGALGTYLIAGPLGAIEGAIWLLVATPLYVVTIRGEDEALRRLYPAEFERYAQSVRALVPGLPPRGRVPAEVTWAHLRTEREPPRLLRFLAGATLVLGLTMTGTPAHVILAVAGLAYGASYGLR